MLRALALLCLATPALAQSGTLVIESEPAGAVVSVDGVRAGRAPVRVDVAPGEHAVRVAYAGYDVYETSASVQAGATADVLAALVRQTGSVAVAAPAGATVTVDGAPADGTVAVPTGDVRVRVEAPGRRPAERVVSVGWQAETRVTYTPRMFDAQAMSLAAFAPGVLQLRGGRPGAGLAAFAGIGGAVAAAVVASGAESRARGRVAEALEGYSTATGETAVQAAYLQVDREFGRVRSARNARNVALGAIGVVWGASVADALLHHVLVPGLRVSPSSGDGRGVRLAVSL